MGLKRLGVLLFGSGLGLSAVTAVVFGFVAGSTLVACPDHTATYTIQNIDILSLSVQYSDGCNYKSVDPVVTGGGLLALTGLLVAGVGVLREMSTDE